MDKGKLSIICLFCTAVIMVPCLIFFFNLKEEKEDILAGAVRLQPGQLFVINKELFEKNPKYHRMMIAEALNRKVFEVTIASPIYKSRFKISNRKNVEEVLLKKNEEEFSGETEGASKIENLIEEGKRNGIIWDSSSGPWGMFIQSDEEKQEGNENPTFGLINIPNGQEKSSYETEKKINYCVCKLLENGVTNKKKIKETGDPLTAVISSAVHNELLTKTEAADLIGKAYILNVKLDPNSELFLSPDSLEDVKEWENIAKNKYNNYNSKKK
jgi:hypothetical protein